MIDGEQITVTDPRRQGPDNALLAFVAFLLVEVAGLALWLTLARRQWFRNDEWAFLAGRTAGNFGDLFRDHYGHWSTFPILVYRLWWWLFGIRSYMPYLLLVVLSHLAIAALLRCVMRRAGVGPWTATAAASLFVLFGTGLENVTFAFLINFNLALVLGLTHLLFADHDGAFDRRDALGLIAGLGALTCSSVGLVMAAAVGLAVLLRRGWRLAALHVGPLLAAYAVWWISIGRNGAQGRFEPGFVFEWVRNGIGAVFDGITQLWGLGVLLGVASVLGVALAWTQLDFATFRRRAAMPAGLAGAALAFLIMSGIARHADIIIGPDYARTSRYVYVIAAMVLPSIAVGVYYFAHQWRLLAPAAIALLLVGIPGNVNTLIDAMHTDAPVQQAARRLVLTLPQTPIAKRVPPSVKPVNEFPEQFVTVGWLLSGVKSGRIPSLGRPLPTELAVSTFRLSIEQTKVTRPPRRCQLLREPVPRVLNTDDVILFSDGVLRLTALAPTPAASAYLYLSYDPEGGNRLRAVAGPLYVQLASNNAYLPASLCEG
jgi:hypothetical protein